MKLLSCATIIYNDNNKFIGCIPFGKKDKLDLPKGLIEEGETLVSCAKREVLEETCLNLSVSNFKKIGVYNYTKDKDLYFFKYKNNFNVNNLKCDSMFEFYNRHVPEVIGYKEVDLFDFEYIKNNFYKSMGSLLIKIIEQEFKNV